MSFVRRVSRAFSLALTPVVLMATVMTAQSPVQVGASSHREAPLISVDPEADTTDVYAFISPDRPDAVTLVANYIPLQAAYGGPNYYKFADDVLYKINLDTTGDARADVTYEFRFSTTTRNPATFLYNTGPISYDANSRSYSNLNVVQVFTVTEVVSASNLAAPRSTVLGSGLLTPPVNVGGKSTPNYDALVAPALHTIKVGANNAPTGVVDNAAPAANDIRVFAGQRDDPFFVDLSSVFDLLSLRPQQPPVGYPEGPRTGVDGLLYANVHSLVIQVPISRLNGASSVTGNNPETVIGVWSTASRQSTRVLNGILSFAAGASGPITNTGDFVQVSRLGMPLVNEAVMPRALKDAFNALDPALDAPLFLGQLNSAGFTGASSLLQSSVLTPELQTLLGALYNVPNPQRPRTDIFEIFLQGIKTDAPFTVKVGASDVTVPAGTNVNQPTNGTPSEMLRLNTAAAFRPGVQGSLCKGTPDYQLGLLGGDVCGFPNGRRLADDVTDIELLAVAGAGWGVVNSPSENPSFSFTPALVSVLDDGVSSNDKPFLSAFPYVPSPWGGKEVGDTYIKRFNLPFLSLQSRTVRAE